MSRALRNDDVAKPGKTHQENSGLGSFKKFLGRDVRLLRMAGLYSMNSVFTSETKKRPSNWEAVSFAIGIFQLVFTIICELRTIVGVWSVDPNYAIETVTPMLSAVLIGVKGMRLFSWREELRHLLRALAVMWDEAQVGMRIGNEIVRSARGSNLVGNYYGTMIVVLVTSYAVKPYIYLLQHHVDKNLTKYPYDYTVTVYPATYPFSIQTMLSYIICITWEQSIFYFFVLYWMAADNLFAQLTTHTSIQFRILCDNLKNITVANDGSFLKNEKELIHRLFVISRRHHDLYMLRVKLLSNDIRNEAETYKTSFMSRCCKTIRNIFNPIMFIMMLLTAANMCFAGFRIDKEVAQGNWDGVLMNLIHVATLLIQAFIYCGYADRLTQQSAMMARAAYECQWIKRSKEFKSLLLIIMMRSQKEFRCSAYGIFFINLNQITTIINTAASYFTLLKSMT